MNALLAAMKRYLIDPNKSLTEEDKARLQAVRVEKSAREIELEQLEAEAARVEKGPRKGPRKGRSDYP